MAGVAYRMWFGDRSATQEELDRVEDIVVEQEMDMAWEARIRMYLCLDDKGRWQHGADTVAAPFSRVRVELSAGGDAFEPLIDGPVAAYDTALSSQPGRSTVTLVVRDDSVLMNRKDGNEVFEGRAAHEIARDVFTRFPEIAKTRVEPTSGTEAVAVQHGTPIALLRKLAHAHGYHAYVLPGELAGQSVGCFLPDPKEPGTLAPLVLLGDDRNITDVEVRENSEGPQRSVAHALRFSDLQVVSGDTKLQDVDLMRPLPPLQDKHVAVRQVAPADNTREDPTIATASQTKRASYAYTVTGRIVPGCYPGVLVPYQRVRVEAGDHPLSGAWLLTKATHHLTPSVYTQEFQAKADSKEDPKAPQEEAAKSGGLSFTFSASISVF